MGELTLHNIVGSRAGIGSVEEGDPKRTSVAVDRVDRSCRARDGDGQSHCLALVLDTYCAVVIEGVVRRDTLAAGGEDGLVARNLIPRAQVGGKVESRDGFRVEAGAAIKCEWMLFRINKLWTDSHVHAWQPGAGPN